MPAYAGKVGVLPPEIDYKKICPAPDNVDLKGVEWKGKTPATSGLSPEKLMELARLYYEGNGKISPDYDQARNIVEYLAGTKGKFADRSLSLKYEMLLSGKGYPQNTPAAKAILKQLMERDNARAYNQYGSLFVMEGNYIKAAEYFRTAFAKGYSRAIIQLAYLYHDKKISGTEQEIESTIEQAQNVLMNALKEGDCDALSQFAMFYSQMSDIPKSEYYSAIWAEKAALQDKPLPKMFLAGIIQRGYVLPYDESRIVHLWKEAAALGSDEAMFLLGEHIFMNYKNDADLKTAAAWLEEAAERRNVKAMEMLGNLYEGQYPALTNEEKRKKWLENAVKSRSAKDSTIMTLANLYEARSDIAPEKIFELHSLAAQKNNNEAYIKMGDSYRYGIGVKAAPARALRYYRLAASGGDTEAMKSLKRGYECGIGTNINPEQEKFWADQMEYYNGTSIIKSAYRFLRSTDNDRKVSEKIEKDLTLMAVARKEDEAMILLGLYYAKKGNNRKSQKWINSALQKDIQSKDNYPAHTLLGTLYLQGVYAPSNPGEGLRLLDIAGRNGNADAYAIRGEWYMNNDIPKSKVYLTLAVARGNYSSYWQLYKLALRDKNKPLAISYLEKAAAKNDIRAMFTLAEIYEKAGMAPSTDGPSNLVKSRDWFDRAIKSYPCGVSDIIFIVNGYLNGRYGVTKDEKLATMWFDRIGVIQPENYDAAIKISNAVLASALSENPESLDKAVTILKTAAEKNNLKAATSLANAYLNPRSSIYNPNLAIELITRGAELGDVPSMIELANMNVAGYGVPPSIDNAILWLKKAAEAGSTDAEARLRALKSSQN